MGWIKITKNNIDKLPVFCPCSDRAMYKKFIEENHIVAYKKEIGRHSTIKNFFESDGKAAGHDYNPLSAYGRLFDHYCFYMTKTGKIILVMHPYQLLKDGESNLSALFDDDFEIQILDSTNSWYYPGNSLMFIIKLKENK